MAQTGKDLFKEGAENGSVLGLVLAVLFVALASSLTVPALGLIAMVLILVVPVLTFFLLRRSFVKSDRTMKFSELWLEGIVMFACGSLIMAIASLIYMKFIQPNYVVDLINACVDFYDQAGDHEMADTFKRIIKLNLVPSRADIAMELIWLGIFSGSMLSMLVSLLVRAQKPPRLSTKPKNNQ